MIDLLRTSNKIIINSDIDGVLSGLILHNFLACEVVGFSNSDNTVWIDESKVNSIYDAVYVDMFVANPAVKCIDQHIISINSTHHNSISKNPNKFNPNFDNPRFHFPNDSYYLKYPFGTVHYIIAYLEKQGIRVDLDFFHQLDGLNFIDILLRADDAMKTTVDSNYKVNAREWWLWLHTFSNKSNSISSLGKYLYSLNSNQVTSIKSTTTKILMSSNFGCTSPDGGYHSIINPNGLLKEQVITYFQWLAKASKLNCFNTQLNLTPFIGTVNRTNLSETQKSELINQNKINGKDIFSYACVRSSNRSENFSYTLM